MPTSKVTTSLLRIPTLLEGVEIGERTKKNSTSVSSLRPKKPKKNDFGIADLEKEHRKLRFDS